MAQPIDAAKKIIGEMLGGSERRPVVLPQFQRPYSWERGHIAAFWADLIGFLDKFRKNPIEASYFLGPVVILDDPREVIILDGQQRLATCTILLAKLRDAARALGGGSQAGADFARDLQRYLIEKSRIPLAYALTLSDLDEPFFCQTVKADPPVIVKPTLRSHLLMQGAADVFAKNVESMINGESTSKSIDVLRDIQNSVTKAMTLVAITVKDEEDAFDIFESLNDRGLRLSVPDLVVNLLLRRCDKKNRQTVRQKWNGVVQELGKRDVSRFLRHLWISQYGDLKTRGLYTEIKNHLSEKKLTSLEFAQTCSDEPEIYVALIDKAVSMTKQARRNLEGLLGYLGVYNSLPLLLSGQICLTDSDFEKLLKATVRIYVRHTLLANENPLELESAFYNAAREIRAQHTAKRPSKQCLLAAKTILEKLNPLDSIVEEKARELVLSRSQARWFMVEIANATQSETKEIGMDKANLEHIFPQNAGADWPNRKELQPYIWHVGNLTILGDRINAKARNKPFKEKFRDHYKKSEIRLTKDLTKLPKTWDAVAIHKRAADLAKKIIRIWS